MISERPAEVEDRAVPGHWEGDLLLGRNPDRNRHLGRALHALLPARRPARRPQRGSCSRRFAHKVDRAAADAASRLSYLGSGPRDEGPPQLHSRERRSGLLLRSPKPLAAGLNENTNGLLRQYFPKRSDLGAVSQAELDHVAASLTVDRDRRWDGSRRPSASRRSWARRLRRADPETPRPDRSPAKLRPPAEGTAARFVT